MSARRNERILSIGCLVAFLTLAGCADATSPSETGGESKASSSEQRDDSFMEGIGGKGDSTYDIEAGGPKARALLEFVNTASLEKLDDGVSLDVRAAKHIVEARKGGDIATLEELDAVPWVGSRAFRKLYTYAKSHGIFDGTSGSSGSVHGIEPGSETAEEILELANTASKTILDDEVGLDSRAARNIVDKRTGGRISSLEELDAIAWVGSRAFGRLLTHVRANDSGEQGPKTCQSDSDCASSDVCVTGTCASMTTAETSIEEGYAHQTTSDLEVDGESVGLGFLQSLGGDTEHRGFNSYKYDIQLGAKTLGTAKTRTTGSRFHVNTSEPELLSSTTGNVLSYYDNDDVRFHGDIGGPLDGLTTGEILAAEAQRVDSQLHVAVSQGPRSYAEADFGTWVWEESRSQMYKLDEDAVDDLEIVEKQGGTVEVLYLDYRGLHRATRGTDRWKSTKVATTSDLFDDESDASNYAIDHVEAVGHDDHVHIVAKTQYEEHTRRSTDYAVDILHFRLHGDTIQQVSSVATGQWRTEENVFESGDGAQKIARDVALDADGNTYLLTQHVIETGHREVRLVKVGHDGGVTRTKVANWPAERRNSYMSTYSIDVSSAGDIAVAGYEEQDGRLHLRTFELVGR